MHTKKGFKNYHLMLWLLLTAVLTAGCVQNQMSVDQAQDVVITMQTKSLAPPPRNSADILSILEHVDTSDRDKFNRIYAVAHMEVPDTTDPRKLASFHLKRGDAIRSLGNYRQAHEEYQKSLEYHENPAALLMLSVTEFLTGKNRKAIELAEKCLELPDTHRGQSLVLHYLLTLYYAHMGDLQGLEEATQQGLIFMRGFEQDPWMQMNKGRMLGAYYMAKGQYQEEEKHRRNAVAYLARNKDRFPLVYLHNKGGLDKSIARQGRLLEAEISARETLRESISMTGKLSGGTSDLLMNLGQILAMSGRSEDARKLMTVGLRNLGEEIEMKDSWWYGEARLKLVGLLATMGDYREAVAEIDRLQRDMGADNEEFNLLIANNLDALLALLMSGRTEMALPEIERSYATYVRHIGNGHINTAELLSLRATARYQMGDNEQALKDFRMAVPILLRELGQIQDFQRKQRLTIMLENYINLLNELRNDGLHLVDDRPSEELILALSEQITISSVNDALGARGARKAVTDSTLKELIRQEQDAATRIEALNDLLAAVVSSPPEQRAEGAISSLQQDIRELYDARGSIQAEITEKFARYDEFVRPQVPDIPTMKSTLHDGEALVVIHSFADTTFVWAISPNTGFHYHAAPVSRATIGQAVQTIRATVDPDPRTIGDIPPFAFTESHWLYETLLKPVEQGWREARDIIVVAPGDLGQIPFTLLVQEPFTAEAREDLLFDSYTHAPWLVKNHGVTRLPSTSSLISLRQNGKSGTDRLNFAGFGDPVFRPGQYGSSTAATRAAAGLVVSRGLPIQTRGIRVSESGSLDDTSISTVQLSDLTPLPDTKDEILSIAAALDGDPERDVFLGERASEAMVSSSLLGNRKVIAFATHGLVPGDIDGLTEPALAFSSPAVTGRDEDGLLTMSEIMRLRLDADWVVLSACNTGAADGKGVEAASGLGRAFFYAGSKALLLTMWPVESTSAKQLTTAIFRFQQEDSSLSRSAGVRKAILDLIENGEMEDPRTGQKVASYAHPLFWAPFIVVGDGSG